VTPLFTRHLLTSPCGRIASARAAGSPGAGRLRSALLLLSIDLSRSLLILDTIKFGLPFITAWGGRGGKSCFSCTKTRRSAPSVSQHYYCNHNFIKYRVPGASPKWSIFWVPRALRGFGTPANCALRVLLPHHVVARTLGSFQIPERVQIQPQGGQEDTAGYGRGREQHLRGPQLHVVFFWRLFLGQQVTGGEA
jgi:hypothetical protein